MSGMYQGRNFETQFRLGEISDLIILIVGLNVAPKGALPFSRGKRVVHRKRVVHHHKFHIYFYQKLDSAISQQQ